MYHQEVTQYISRKLPSSGKFCCEFLANMSECLFTWMFRPNKVVEIREILWDLITIEEFLHFSTWEYNTRACRGMCQKHIRHEQLKGWCNYKPKFRCRTLTLRDFTNHNTTLHCLLNQPAMSILLIVFVLVLHKVKQSLKIIHPLQLQALTVRLDETMWAKYCFANKYIDKEYVTRKFKLPWHKESQTWFRWQGIKAELRNGSRNFRKVAVCETYL